MQTAATFSLKYSREFTRRTFIRQVWAPPTDRSSTSVRLTISSKCCYFSRSPSPRTSVRATFSRRLTRNKTRTCRLKKVSVSGHRGKPHRHKGPAPGRRRPAGPAEGAGPASRVRPGPSLQWTRRGCGAGRSGSSGTHGGGPAVAPAPAPGLPGSGTSARMGDGASWLSAAGTEGGARPRRPGRAGELGPAPDPGKHFPASPAPLAKMATWTEGEPGPRGWGSEGRGGKAETKRRPPERRGRPASPDAGGGRGRRRARAYFFLSFAPPAPSMANRSPRCLHGRRPPGSLRPKLALSARGERRRGASRGAQPPSRPGAGGAGGRRGTPGRAPRSFPLRQLVKARPGEWLQRRRGRCSRPLGRGCTVLCGAEAAAGGGQGRRRARGRAGGAGRREPGTRRPAEPGARSRQPASPEGEAGSLRANGERRRRPSPTPAHVCFSQSGAGQLRHSWAALTCSSVCSCGGKRKALGCGQPGLGTCAFSKPGKAVADLGRRC